ncbi:MAG: SDR family oxidoreductase [Sphingobacteriaceae bacterium]
MKRILVTGSNGLLGQKITDLFLSSPDFELIASSNGPNRHPVKTGYTYVDLDVCDAQAVLKIIESEKPDIIIHTAAMTNVDACETDLEGCRKLNVDAVKNLASLCAEHNIHLVHLSTDFIFDGADGPYAEDAQPNPLSYYGQSKLDAEQAILASGCRAAILRTIIVYGIVQDMSRSNIVLWAKGALEKGEPISVVNDQWRMPTLAEDLAVCCLLAAMKEAEGIYNASGKDMMNMVELVEQVADFWQLNKRLIKPITSESLNQKARRPAKTGFILDKSIRELGYRPHSFLEGLAILDSQLKA